MVQISLSSVNNNGLFAQHYLENRLPAMDEWEETKNLEKAYEEVKYVWEQEKDIVNNYNEAQLEENFIKKIFSILNHSYGVQASVKENALRPDYGFFKTEKDLKQAHKQKNVDDFYKNSIAVGDAKQWGVTLDKKTKYAGDEYDKKNPSWQIYIYLKETPANWGILTNGKKWRLYNEETSDHLDTYYEIDLPTILEKEDRGEALQEFKYFYLFFRQKAFTPTKKSFLDKIFKQSEKYSQRIGDNLEESVYRALLWMAKGYYQNSSNWNDPDDDYPDFLSSNKINYSELDQEEKNEIKDIVGDIHHHSLVFLYRLLFLFYAESKDKLGRDVPKNYDFDGWVESVLNDLDEGEIFEKGGTLNYRLRDIFKLLKEGSEGMGLDDQFFVPAYNGDLFETKEFLDQHNIHDGFVAKVVDLLARDPLEKEEGRGRVDYSDLSIRHIGGIYEGLLEYEPKIAEEDIVAENEEWKSLKETNKNFKDFKEEDRAREGEIYLETDEGERKATGSYYTPEYIVQYIVQNTIKPKLEEKLEGLETDKEKREAILDINVLDPAMGSGHFLVDALDLLANKLVKYAPEEVDGKEIDWAKRKVVRNCLYGVDDNPLATELAKVSLWLQTMTEDKPLPFLDHHLKTGNSLIGANIKALEKHPEEEKEEQKQEAKTETEKETDKDNQVHILDFVGEPKSDEQSIEEKIDEILQNHREIMKTTESRPDDIKEEKRIYQRFRNNDLLLRLKMLADIHTSHYFGNNFTKEQYEELKNSLTQKEWKEIAEKDWIKNYSDNLPKKYRKEDDNREEDDNSKQKQFFHWGLEFPQVFLREKNGFDAVIGNPPYVMISNFDLGYQDYLEKFETGRGYKPDLYMAFQEKSLDLCRKGGYNSQIIPNRFFLTKPGTELREFFSGYEFLEIVDFGLSRIFSDALNYVCIPTVKNSDPDNNFIYKKSNESLEITDSYRSSHSHLERELWYFPDESMKPIQEKIESKSVNISDYISDMFAGIQTGNDPLFTVDKPPKDEEEIYSRFLRAKDIFRYSTNQDAEFIIFPYDENGILEEDVLRENFSKTYQFLNSNKEKLLDRVWHNQGPVERSGKWYGLMYMPDPEKFYKNKIICPYVAQKNAFMFDERNQIFGAGAGYGLLTEPSSDQFKKLLTGVLNSKVILYELSLMSPEFQSGFKYNKRYLSKLPVPKNMESTVQSKKNKIKEGVTNLTEKKRENQNINLNIQDYLGNYSDGKTLGDFYTPAEGISNNIITDTSPDRKKLRIGSVEIEDQNNNLVLKASARYKPENPDESDDLDRWGYFETEKVPAMKFDVDEKLRSLIKEFVPVAVDESGGFANFRENATKTNSIIDRLEKLTLPKLEDVEKGLEKFIENKEKAEKLEREIQETDNEIDAIVFDLYDLTKSEVETVLDSLDTDNKVKKDILSKFRDIKG